MKKTVLLFAFVILLAALPIARAFSYEGGDLNVVDAAGLRQGTWCLTAGMLKLGAPWVPDQIVWRGSFKDSYRIGTWIEYDSNGDKITEWSLNAEGTNLLVKNFNEKGVLTSERRYSYRVSSGVKPKWNGDNGTYSFNEPATYIQHEGVEQTFYPDGTMWTEVTWTNGRLHGPAKTFHPNGKVCEEGNWSGSFWQGDYKLYDRNGNEIK